MNTPSNVRPGSPIESRVAEPPNRPANDLMYWSIRRELWENRSLTIAPLAVAAFALFVLLMTTAFSLPHKMRNLPTLDAAKRHAVIVSHFSMTPTVIMVTTILVGIFYSLDALYGERRDRSILFWKSLPVSDLTTVLSKAAIPLVVLPLIGFALSMATQLILLLWSTAVLMGSGMSPAPLWAELRLLEMPVTLVYGIGVFTLWHAPMYGWLLLVSGWARRTPVLWAFLPMLVISVVERMTFQTSHFGSLMRYRFMGAMTAAFNVTPTAKGHYEIIDRFDQLNPLKFLGTPGLWLGLLLAAAFLAAAVRLRRYREPI
jgi:ABC-2 type transport system permease protein